VERVRVRLRVYRKAYLCNLSITQDRVTFVACTLLVCHKTLDAE
jgi:hypothetical protein